MSIKLGKMSMTMRKFISHYGWGFDLNTHPLEVEFECIRRGGKWQKKSGNWCGEGLFFHYKAAIGLLWPQFKQHRWFETMLEAWIGHEWIGVAGPKDASKSGTMAVIHLADYYAFPNNTTTILSSTTKEALKNRIWAEVSMRHREAKEKFEWLPGYIIEGDLRLVTDIKKSNVDIRDMRNGMVGIPIKRGDIQAAMSLIIGIKNKRKRWVCDEAQTLPPAALDATANFFQNDSDCKVIGLGNPSDIMDAHGKLCEPHSSLGGWQGGIDQQGKTKTWRTRFENGVCVQLPGSDSPNMDVPIGVTPPFPFLMTRERMEKDAETWTRTDWHYMMFNEGRWPRGQAANRVITRQMCLLGHAMDAPTWANTNITKIGCMDAGFGGDRCVFHELWFGRELWKPKNIGEVNASNLISQTPPEDENRQIIALVDTQIIPIEGSDVKGAEDQIVEWCRRECVRRGIAADNFFYEPGMRTSLVQKFSQLWSSKPVSIDFGGKPSDAQVSSDIPVNCREYYFNFVTELWYTVRLVIESQQFRGLTETTMDEACMREFKRGGGNKIQIETKKEYKQKTGFSPDNFDALVCGIYGAIKHGFSIKRQKAFDSEEVDESWKRELEQRAKDYRKRGRLQYA
jgi:hypothetical protein